ncbi:MAG TPA: hypothetical protein VF407_13765, partial [Polyangiaceae bacterium]
MRVGDAHAVRALVAFDRTERRFERVRATRERRQDRKADPDRRYRRESPSRAHTIKSNSRSSCVISAPLDIEVFHAERVLFDERAARLDLIAHE